MLVIDATPFKLIHGQSISIATRNTTAVGARFADLLLGRQGRTYRARRHLGVKVYVRFLIGLMGPISPIAANAATSAIVAQRRNGMASYTVR